MRRVFKYELLMCDHINIILPKGAEILKVGVQSDQPFMWTLIDPDAPDEKRSFRIVGTGHSIDEINLKFIDTFQLSGGDLIFHIFEILGD